METQQYNGIDLFASEVEFLKEIENLLQKQIPCLEDRNKARQTAMAIMGNSGAQIAQIEASIAQIENQSPLKMQYQQIQMMEAQYNRQTGLSEEQLVEFYISQFLSSVTPEYKAQIQNQLAMLIPMMGENHPTILQLKEVISMDEEKARKKSENMARFYVPFLKLRSKTLQEIQILYDKMYDSNADESELKKALTDYYTKIATPEYQSELMELAKLAPDTVGMQDPNFLKLQSYAGLTQEKLPQFVEQQFMQTKQNIQTLKSQTEMQTTQLKQTLAQLKNQTQEPSFPKLSISQFGFICDNNRIIGLNLAGKDLAILPDSIENLSELEVLHLENNLLTTLPESFGNLIKLKELDISGMWSTNDDRPFRNPIRILPNSFGKLKSLEIWRMEECGVEKLPDSIINLILIKELRLTQNLLTSIPIAISNWVNCEVIELRSNKFTEFPISICELPRLHHLDLGFNQIIEIPPIIDQLKSLRLLLLDGNQIVNIQPNLFKLTELTTLGLSYNKITDVPEGFSDMNLRTLKLEHNQISGLPYFVWQMNSLNELTIGENPLSLEEKTIAQNDTETIKKYCRERASAAIMFIYSEDDAENHRITDLIKFLEDQSEVFGIIPGIEENIDSTDLAFFMATAASIQNIEKLEIIQKLKARDINIIPIKGLDISWGDMASIGLSRELGHEYSPYDFEGFCGKIYDYIKLLKRSHNIFKTKTGVVRKSQVQAEKESPFTHFKQTLTSIIQSDNFKKCFDMYQPYLQSQYLSISQQPLMGLAMLLMTYCQYLGSFLQANPEAKL